jgi:ADP-ribose pyrophosphatase
MLPSSNVDSANASLIAKQVQKQGPSILLQKQWRPPVGKVVIEVPAGLIDEGETPEECALRELKEETGYTGQVVNGEFGVTPIMFNGTCILPGNVCSSVISNASVCTDPGFCTTNLRMVHVTIDLSLEENLNPRTQLEENEFIECFVVPLTSLYQECKTLEEQGYAIDARVGTLAEGIEIAKRWKLS